MLGKRTCDPDTRRSQAGPGQQALPRVQSQWALPCEALAEDMWFVTSSTCPQKRGPRGSFCIMPAETAAPWPLREDEGCLETAG